MYLADLIQKNLYYPIIQVFLFLLDKNNILYSDNSNISVFDTKEEEESIEKEIKLKEEMVLCFINKTPSEVMSNI